MFSAGSLYRSLGLFGALFAQSAGVAAAPVSIIFVIGDGMGPSYTTAYRYFADDPATADIETSVFDELLVGMARTYPGDSTLVTDSAAAATALSTGVKTRNGAIGVDEHHKPVQTLLEAAKARGYQTAMVATSPITHATPGSFAAHVGHRSENNEIADQYFDQRIDGRFKLDLLLGGGRQYFERKDRNLVKEFRKHGYAFAGDWQQRHKLKRLPALGLFAPEGMPSALDSEQPLRLQQMTEQALDLLGKKPFFLLVEASQIDWCGHANDIACAMAEMRDMDGALRVLKAYVDKHPDTLMVVTADHGTGGLSIGANGVYDWDVASIRGIKATANRIADQLLAADENWQEIWLQLTGMNLSEAEQRSLQRWIPHSRLSGEDAPQQHNPAAVKGALVAQVLTLINKRTHTGWTTSGHTGEDVQVFAYGKGHEHFAGNLNNTDIAKHLFRVFAK
ncbi:alkaline phosphatase III [Cellvibrio japonicus Ueda107]|uniref:Alkaline phosphatase III n=1 Tax=Cellvibrio japonicus (strain Ueda107) TaxID=498211 RepID=B3PD38_CELJU|nr:alkaline phosphatase III [Cellvibrio japonicus Ueda107]QEI11971.1 alkaline phosphatase [Cellvibrio japonicus]QEI15545.1 alkaline phosphatase [Cellvibrio japonicus]QEI19124.1 alkaline phosphatase [Cellvibrio japonicus]